MFRIQNKITRYTKKGEKKYWPITNRKMNHERCRNYSDEGISS